MGIQIERITPNLGAYVKVSPEELAKDGVPGQVLEALNAHNLLVFPQVNMSDEQFAQRLRAA